MNSRSIENFLLANQDLFEGDYYTDEVGKPYRKIVDVDDLPELFKRFLESDEYLEYLAEKVLAKNNSIVKA